METPPDPAADQPTGDRAGPAEALHSTSAAEPVGAYSHARRVGGLLFLAGIGPRNRGSKSIPGVVQDSAGVVTDYDIAAQMHSCFANVRLILEQAGSSWSCIIDMTVFLTDIKRDFSTVNSLWAAYFPDPATQPCRTTIEVRGLPQAGAAPINFEVKVIASIAEAGASPSRSL